MKPMFATLLAAAGLAVTAGAAAALPMPSQVYVFGDSLSDPGNFNTLTAGAVAGPPYVTGHFSNGPTFAEYFASLAGRPTQNYITTPGVITPTAPVIDAYLTGNGINFAFGGARTSDSSPLPPPSALEQIAALQGIITGTGAPLKDNALALLSIGPNNYFQDLATTLPGDVPALISGVVSDIGLAVNTLAALGFDSIVVVNMPNLGTTIAANQAELVAPGTAANLTGITMAHNNALSAVIAALDASLAADIRLFDAFGWGNALQANALAAGFTNLTVPCLVPVAPFGVAATCDGAYFVDGVHPTTAVHQNFANALFAATVPEPASLALFGAGIAGLGLLRRRRAA